MEVKGKGIGRSICRIEGVLQYTRKRGTLSMQMILDEGVRRVCSMEEVHGSDLNCVDHTKLSNPQKEGCEGGGYFRGL